MKNERNLRTVSFILTVIIILYISDQTYGDFEKRVKRSDLTVMNPRFRSHAPRRQEVMLGDRLKLRCAAVSKPRPYVHWYRNNELLSKGQKPRIKMSQYTLTITRVEPGDEGQYACKVWNQVGQIWRNITVVIIDLDQWKIEMNAAAEKAARYRQQLASKNQDPKDVKEWLDPEWVKGGFGHRQKSPSDSQNGDVRRSKNRQNKEEDDEDDDMQEDQLEKLTSNPIDNNEVNDRVSSDEQESSGWSSSISPSSTTSSNLVGTDARAPIDMDRPQNDFAPWWDKSGVGIGSVPTFMKNGESKEENDTGSIRTTQRIYPKPTSNTPSTIPPISLLDTWERAPYWHKSEQEMLQLIATPAGRSVKFPCRANGKPEPQVLWYKNNMEIGADTDRNSGYTYLIKKWALTLEDVVPSDEGVYTCKVFNKLGEITHNYTLKVVERLPHKPIIAPEYPKNGTVFIGDNHTFRCYVLSDLHPHIKWFRHFMINDSYNDDEGQPYIDQVYSDPEMDQDEDGYQDPTYLFMKNVTRKDQGWYTCVVGNSIGFSYRTVYLTVLERNDSTSFGFPLPIPNTASDGSHKTIVGLVVCVIVAILAFGFTCVYRKYKKKNKQRSSPLREMSSHLAHGFLKERKIVKINYQKDYVSRSISSSSLLCSSDEFPVPHVEIMSSPDNRCRLSTQLTALSEYDMPLHPDWKIQSDALKLEKPIGEGAFGEVWCAKLTSPSMGAIRLGTRPALNAETVAVKTLKCSATDRELCDLIKELEVMRYIGRHQNIINLLGYCTAFETGKPLYVVVEYCANGNLRDYLRSQRPQQNQSQQNSSSGGLMYSSNDGGHRLNRLTDYEEPNSRRSTDTPDSPERVIFTEIQLVQLVHQIARGMEYLSNKKCVHRDLAARNVLVTDGLIMKIADFGLARNISETEYYKKMSDGRLPLKWMAPEALFDRTYTIKSDVWSFGILVWEVMTLGGTPYPSVPHQELFKLLRESYRMEKPHQCSDDMYQLMTACWLQFPKDRPTFSRIVEYLDEFLMQAHPDDYVEVQSQAPIDEFEDLVPDEINQLDEVNENSSMLQNGAIESSSNASSPSPSNSPIDGDCIIHEGQRASTSDSACFSDAEPSTSSPRASPPSNINLRLNSMANCEYTHHRLSGSPLPSPRDKKLHRISENYEDAFEERSSSGGGRAATDSGHPSSRGGSYEGSSDSVDSGHSLGGGSSSDSYDHRNRAKGATSLRRHHPRTNLMAISQPRV